MVSAYTLSRRSSLRLFVSMRLPRYGWPDGVPPNGMRLRCGRAPHRADPLRPQARHNRQILRCGFQGPPFSAIAHIPEELAMAWGRRAVWPRMKTRPHKPAVRARRGLINAADAAPTDKTRPRLLSQEILQVKKVNPSRICPRRQASNACSAADSAPHDDQETRYERQDRHDSTESREAQINQADKAC